MSLAHPIAMNLADGEEKILPCGMRTLFIAPGEDTASFDIYFNSDSYCTGVKVPFNYEYPQALRSATANPAKVVAHGNVHLIYSL